MFTQLLQDHARELLSSGKVSCVIGYEVSPRNRTRPAFVYQVEDVDRLTWNQHSTYNLTVYLRDKLKKGQDRVAVVLKPCDSKAFNMLLAENKIDRNRVHVIGIMCDGIVDERSDFHSPDTQLQSRCLSCELEEPLVYDHLIGDKSSVSRRIESAVVRQDINRLDELSPEERGEFWLSQFDRCIRCYACRQACPICDCPTCLYERNDSLWVGAGSGVNEKRTFHLGRAFHLAGRCVGCNECERVCPMEIPISLLNQKLAAEMEAVYKHKAGMTIAISPIITIISETD